MVRKAPPSPALADAALDVELARAPRPVLPPGLAARIVAQATALPQHDATDASLQRADDDVARTAQVIAFAQPVAAAPEETIRPPRRMLAGGLAALAAVLVAAVVIGQQGQSVVAPAKPETLAVRREAAPMPAPGVKAATVNAAPAAVQVAEASAPVAPLRISPPQSTSARAEAISQPETVVVPVPAAVPAAQFAVSVPPAARESAGPTIDPSPRPELRGGIMGPPAPQQGWAFSSGAASGGASLPGGQSLPNQTTGSAPPPPPPPGH